MTTMTSHVEPAQSILIIGLGLTGLSCARFLTQRGFVVAIMDTRAKPPALPTLQEELPEVIVNTGSLEPKLIQQADLIVLSPGIDPRLAEIVAAKEAGIEIVGDIELFARYCNAPVVAITGSNGKSTVTTLLAEMAKTSGKRIQVGGNLGTPALDLIMYPAPDFYIVELSSFQLETVTTLNAFVATVLNVSPDHLDRYDNEQAYQAAKATIFNGDGVMIINRDDDNVVQLARANRKQIGFSLQASDGLDFGVIIHNDEPWLAEGSQPLMAVAELNIKGTHNTANALSALALGSAMGLSMVAMLKTLHLYKGLAHRCRLVLENDGVQWFNDSKATNVGACIAAIEGLATSGRIILIAGGVGKDQNFSELTAVIEQHVVEMIVLGQDADRIEAILPEEMIAYRASDMSDAVKQAHSLAKEGEIVLLSPACASFDMFSGYEQRGRVFEKNVGALVHD